MISLYDVSGARVRTLVNEPRRLGTHTVRWDGRDDDGNDVATGVYFYRLISGNRIVSRKAVLVR